MKCLFTSTILLWIICKHPNIITISIITLYSKYLSNVLSFGRIKCNKKYWTATYNKYLSILSLHLFEFPDSVTMFVPLFLHLHQLMLQSLHLWLLFLRLRHDRTDRKRKKQILWSYGVNQKISYCLVCDYQYLLDVINNNGNTTDSIIHFIWLFIQMGKVQFII